MIGAFAILWIVCAIVYVECYVHVARKYCGGIPKDVMLWPAYFCWPVLVVLWFFSQTRKDIQAVKTKPEEPDTFEGPFGTVYIGPCSKCDKMSHPLSSRSKLCTMCYATSQEDEMRKQ